MAKANTRRQKRKAKAPTPANDYLDATIERLAKGDHSEMVETKAEGQSSRTVLTRRFRASRLDALHRNGKLTVVQHFAGDWYRTRAEEAACSPSVIGGYGQGAGGSAQFYAFLPRTLAQLDAQSQLRQARAQWPIGMQGFMDRFLIRDEMPRYGGKQAVKALKDIRNALDELARWLRVGC